MSQQSAPFYITTAISYPNGRPHIGHAYEAIATDVMARFQRARGRNVRLVTGTDEHGLKMFQTARDQGRATIDLANEMSGYFREMYAKLNISYDMFMRTSDPAHHAASQAIWKAMEANGDLYLDRYEGWYSVRDEAFYDESELTDGGEGIRLSPQGTPVEWTVEESWFFRLSNYQDRLLALYRDNPDFIRPESRRNEVLRFVEGGLKDLSVSRTSFDWGVPVPGSPGHVMYVWVDALTTYLSGLGYPDPASDFGTFWPANIHMIGKDIVRFHTVYWPAFLMSANLPLPRQVFGHGFLLNRGEKMSKSLGNVVDPMALAERFGVDALRYYLLREVSFGQDGSYSAEAIVRTANADLANSFGNLAQRSLSMIFKNLGGELSADYTPAQDDIDLFHLVNLSAKDLLPRAFEQLAFSVGIEEWLRAVFACNQYVDAQAPWALRKSDPERMRVVLMTLFQAVRTLAIAIRPVVPTAADNLLDQMGIAPDARDFAALADADWFARLAASGFTVGQPVPIFPRLDLPEEEGEGEA
ncbi:methionine--tRNA ligase [Sphingopyxis alaskensis]|jgi:methionyl-tRNA synthetase|uniref:Methionine--tRNA ligase n=1 Tax=Sphingopyxis alaskensis (strain DSM 13593 / LMG 18877 / RB2256) TaxID=317655 RepID=Q1GTP9_SPHAL|nr:methionine--tRNA ligase [Sphingopyxis alaskensis]ABF52973.1 methionyl-tRNA synthetase [Sphingopyxis alaskensis RB2256]MCM3420139.1 methionine--tRNA ligase [Sphingopyxis alaskensis]